MKRQNLRTVALIVVTLTYLLIGAAIFGLLESSTETELRFHLDLIERTVRTKYNISDDDFDVLEVALIRAQPHRAGPQWQFAGAFYFALTVVTTIGYGHSSPTTLYGKTFCMVYALIGIPLGLVMFQSIGERLNTFVAASLKYVKQCVKSKNSEVTQTNLVMVVLVLSTVLMTTMAAVFSSYEKWEYMDSLYYCFITLTTIGFGDYVALQKDEALAANPEYVSMTIIFILFGLSVVSSAVNLLVLRFLTLNTEDEKRDEAFRYNAAHDPIQLDGDIITLSSGRQIRTIPNTNDSSDGIDNEDERHEEDPLNDSTRDFGYIQASSEDLDSLGHHKAVRKNLADTSRTCSKSLGIHNKSHILNKEAISQSVRQKQTSFSNSHSIQHHAEQEPAREVKVYNEQTSLNNRAPSQKVTSSYDDASPMNIMSSDQGLELGLRHSFECPQYRSQQWRAKPKRLIRTSYSSTGNSLVHKKTYPDVHEHVHFCRIHQHYSHNSIQVTPCPHQRTQSQIVENQKILRRGYQQNNLHCQNNRCKLYADWFPPKVIQYSDKALYNTSIGPMSESSKTFCGIDNENKDEFDDADVETLDSVGFEDKNESKVDASQQDEVSLPKKRAHVKSSFVDVRSLDAALSSVPSSISSDRNDICQQVTNDSSDELKERCGGIENLSMQQTATSNRIPRT